jgi:hypothetical protein
MPRLGTIVSDEAVTVHGFAGARLTVLNLVAQPGKGES